MEIHVTNRWRKAIRILLLPSITVCQAKAKAVANGEREAGECDGEDPSVLSLHGHRVSARENALGLNRVRMHGADHDAFPAVDDHRMGAEHRMRLRMIAPHQACRLLLVDP